MAATSQHRDKREQYNGGTGGTAQHGDDEIVLSSVRSAESPTPPPIPVVSQRGELHQLLLF